MLAVPSRGLEPYTDGILAAAPFELVYGRADSLRIRLLKP